MTEGSGENGGSTHAVGDAGAAGAGAENDVFVAAGGARDVRATWLSAAGKPIDQGEGGWKGVATDLAVGYAREDLIVARGRRFDQRPEGGKDGVREEDGHFEGGGRQSDVERGGRK